jgi:hypothetical protein
MSNTARKQSRGRERCRAQQETEARSAKCCALYSSTAVTVDAVSRSFHDIPRSDRDTRNVDRNLKIDAGKAGARESCSQLKSKRKRRNGPFGNLNLKGQSMNYQQARAGLHMMLMPVLLRLN